jgi:hypothetical protein
MFRMGLMALYKMDGASGTNRTCDPPLRRGMLYPLSYGGAGLLKAPVYRSEWASVDGRMVT